MKKNIFKLFLLLSVTFTLISCMVPAYSQDDIYVTSNDDVDINIIIKYGIPTYYEGNLIYYSYNGWYYYPYYYNNYWRYYRYREPFPMYPGYRFRPHIGHNYYTHRPHKLNNHHFGGGYGGKRPPLNNNWHSKPNGNYNRPPSTNRFGTGGNHGNSFGSGSYRGNGGSFKGGTNHRGGSFGGRR